MEKRLPLEEIPSHLPHLNMAQIFDALSYYNENQDEIKITILSETAYLITCFLGKTRQNEKVFIEMYFDEDVSPIAAKSLRNRGYRVLTTQETARKRATDADQLAYAQ